MKPEDVLDIALAKTPDAAALKAAMLSDDFVMALKERIESSPAERRRRDFVVEYGERHGGTVLKLLQLFDGAYWGSCLELTFEQCALVLGESPETLAALYDEMLTEIRPHLLGSEGNGAGAKQGGVAGIALTRKSARTRAKPPGERTLFGRGRRRETS